MAPLIYVVVPVTGLKKSCSRAIAFLVCDGSPDVDGITAFEHLSEAKERELRTRFDYWIEHQRQDKYFHGWPNEPSNKHCFVFKWKEKNVNQRLYGFKFNPKPKTSPGFQVCILVSHGTKGEWETDPGHKTLANLMRSKQAVIDAIKIAFPDVEEGDKSCMN